MPILRHQLELALGGTAADFAAAFASMDPATRLTEVVLTDASGRPVTRLNLTVARLILTAPAVPTLPPAKPEPAPPTEPEPAAAPPVQPKPIPVRTDAELRVQLLRLERRSDGTVAIQRAAKALGIGSYRAERLLRDAGLLREKNKRVSRTTSRATSVRRALATA
ncbi:hypothetical protein I6A60_01820 [Frankia sp. AgB1.9]|uniref:hypothetical protein n=1 Tax=unclassified Frankia TaxID=2632575 RepID=UPI0019349F76|nr:MULTISPECIES: hypothetical protein [unclassified Frankia]MBL7494451.1 hypothetical protein [Frankia sp. AgW1.1]MBL7546623.1 hypothetical protein [Frankia sp. AgB1.9]MBL7622391.1 hypothetical protein [Frankia sp. AgB1.8]